MNLFKKEKKVYIFYKNRYYNVADGKQYDSLQRKDKEGAFIYGIKDQSQHLNKYDKKQKYKYQTEIEGIEYGISTSDLDINFMLDYLYYKEGMKYSNIIIRSDYFSIVLKNNISINMVLHSKEEGQNLEMLAEYVSNEQFMYEDLEVLMDEIEEQKGEMNPLAALGVIGLFIGGAYWFVAEEEEEIVYDYSQNQIIVNKPKDNNQIKKELRSLKMSDKQELYKSLYLQRMFLNKLLAYKIEDPISKMFQFITKINIVTKNLNYEYEVNSLIEAQGFKKAKGDLYARKIEFNPFEDKQFEKELKKEIIKEEAKYKEMFGDVELSKKNLFTKMLRDYNVEEIKDVKTRKDVEREILVYENKYREISKQGFENYLKTRYGFEVYEIKKEATIMRLKEVSKGDKVFELLKLFRDLNVPIDALKVDKVSKNINTDNFKISCQIKIIKE